MDDVVKGKMDSAHTEIRQHQEGFDFVPGNRSLPAVQADYLTAEVSTVDKSIFKHDPRGKDC